MIKPSLSQGTTSESTSKDKKVKSKLHEDLGMLITSGGEWMKMLQLEVLSIYANPIV